MGFRTIYGCDMKQYVVMTFSGKEGSRIDIINADVLGRYINDFKVENGNEDIGIDVFELGPRVNVTLKIETTIEMAENNPT